MEDHYGNAERALRHEDAMARRGGFHGDRESYLRRYRERAIAEALLAVAQAIETATGVQG